MINLITIFMPIINRLFNKFTPVGIINFIVGAIMLSLGFSDDMVKWGVEQDYSPIIKMVAELTNHPVALVITGLFMVSIGGFYIWRHDYEIKNLQHLENKVKELNLIKNINILQREIQDDIDKSNTK